MEALRQGKEKETVHRDVGIRQQHSSANSSTNQRHIILGQTDRMFKRGRINEKYEPIR